MPIIQLENQVLGGIADSKYLGIANSSAKLLGIDLHSEPGIMKVNQKLTKESGSTIDDFVRAIVPCSSGDTYIFGSTSGKVWKRTSAGAYSLVTTVSPAAGAAGILDAKEYDGYIYYATQNRLGRWQIGSAADWSTRNDNFGTFTNGNANFHPMIIQNLVLYIGDGNLVAQVDAGTFSANALDFDLLTEQQVSAIGLYLTDIVAGVYKGESIVEAEGYRWNTWSNSFSASDPVPHVGVNAFLKSDNETLAQIGRKGDIYAFNGSQFTPKKRIPGDWTGTKEAIVYSNAAVNRFGLPLFGVSNKDGNPCEQGIYSYGSYSEQYPRVLNLEYIISTGHTSSVRIGAITLVGNLMLVSWEDTTSGTVYGVDVLDLSNKQTAAAYESRVIMPDRRQNKNLAVWVNYRSIPENCSIVIKASRNDGVYEVVASKVDADRKFVYAENKVTAAKIQFRVEFVVSGNSAPEMESVIIDYV
jgi:hypothetical protein